MGYFIGMVFVFSFVLVVFGVLYIVWFICFVLLFSVVAACFVFSFVLLVFGYVFVFGCFCVF